MTALTGEHPLDATYKDLLNVAGLRDEEFKKQHYQHRVRARIELIGRETVLEADVSSVQDGWIYLDDGQLEWVSEAPYPPQNVESLETVINPNSISRLRIWIHAYKRK